HVGRVVDRNAHEFDALAMQSRLLSQPGNRWHLLNAGPTPGRPDVQEHRLPLETGEADGLVVQVDERPLVDRRLAHPRLLQPARTARSYDGQVERTEYDEFQRC